MLRPTQPNDLLPAVLLSCVINTHPFPTTPPHHITSHHTSPHLTSPNTPPHLTQPHASPNTTPHQTHTHTQLLFPLHLTLSACPHTHARRRQRLLPERQALPVWAAHESLVAEVAAHPTLVVVGETGSGKTTQV